MPRLGNAVALLGLVAALVPASTGAAATAAAPPTCDGRTATIVGTPGADRLRGTHGPDVIAGLGGDDRIRGLGGNDRLCGGKGADRLDGGRGDDRVIGGWDKEWTDRHGEIWFDGDVVSGGPGDDWLDPVSDPRIVYNASELDTVAFHGATRRIRLDLRRGTARGQGRDRVARDEGIVLRLTRYDDVARGNRGDNTFETGAGDDRVHGGGGNDAIFPDRGAGRGGRDVVRGGGGADFLYSEQGRDTLRGGARSDSIYLTSPARTVLRGGTGNDWVEVRLRDGRDQTLTGGPGKDRLQVRAGADSTLDLDAGTLDVAGWTHPLRVRDFEELDLRGRTSWLWTVLGTDAREWIWESRPRVHFHGRGGKDILNGSAGDDHFDGGPGVDEYWSDEGGTNTCVDVEDPEPGTCSG